MPTACARDKRDSRRPCRLPAHVESHEFCRSAHFASAWGFLVFAELSSLDGCAFECRIDRANADFKPLRYFADRHPLMPQQSDRSTHRLIHFRRSPDPDALASSSALPGDDSLANELSLIFTQG